MNTFCTPSPSSAVPRAELEMLANCLLAVSSDKPNRSASNRTNASDFDAPSLPPVAAASELRKPIIALLASMIDFVAPANAPAPMNPAKAPTACERTRAVTFARISIRPVRPETARSAVAAARGRFCPMDRAACSILRDTPSAPTARISTVIVGIAHLRLIVAPINMAILPRSVSGSSDSTASADFQTSRNSMKSVIDLAGLPFSRLALQYTAMP